MRRAACSPIRSLHPSMLAWAALFLGAVSAAAPARSQDGLFFPVAPREQKQLLARAIKAKEEQRYEQAVDALGQLLTGDLQEPVEGGDQDFFVGGPGSVGTQTSFKIEAQRLLGSLPEEALGLYELRFGRKSQQLLDEALESGDEAKLTEVSRRYFHTKAGHQATVLLGRHHLDRGHPLGAALCLMRVREWPSAREQYEPSLSLLLASCWKYAEMPDRAVEVLSDLKRRVGRNKLELAGKQFEMFTEQQEPLQWLEQLLGKFESLADLHEAQWVMFRGNANRNAKTKGSLPVLNPRWRVPSVNDPLDEELVAKSRKDNKSGGKVLLPSFQPLAVNDVILMRSAQRLFAVDLVSGKRIWEFPWDTGASAGELAQSTNTAKQSAREMQLRQRVWADAAYGQLSSDGRSVYLIDGLSYAANNRYTNFGFVRPTPEAPANVNTLVALELATEGKLKWSVGGTSGGREPALAGAFFLGPPLPLQGELYVLAEVNHEIRLAVLEAETGKLRWQQRLAHLDNGDITKNPTRRLAGATPSFADGVLVCPTSAGAVVALDVAARSLLWGYRYHTRSKGNSNANPFGNNNPANDAVAGWQDATVAIVDGRVYLTPAEADDLYCLDLLTGKNLWPGDDLGDSKVAREKSIYLGCVHRDRAVVVGSDAVRGIDVNTGEEIWSVPLSAPPSGTGFYSGQSYFVPTQDSKIARVNLDEGTLAAEVATSLPMGNLLCYRDQIISQGSDWLSIFHQSEPLKAEVDRRLAKDPNDIWALARKCEILLQGGEHQAAFQELRRVHQLAPNDVNTRSLLVQTMLVALKQDFAKHYEAISELEDLITLPSDRAVYLQLQAEHLEKTGQARKAFTIVLELIDNAVQLPNEPLQQISTDRQIRRTRWIRARVAALLDAFAESPDDAAFAQQQIIQRQKLALADGAIKPLREFLDYFADHPAALPARLALAAKYLESEELLRAQLTLADLDQSADETTAARATALLARIFEKAGQSREASLRYHLLATRFADVPCDSGMTGMQLAQAAKEPVGKQLPAWNYGRVEAKLGPLPSNRRTSSYPRFYPVTLRQSSSSTPRGINVRYDQRRSMVQFCDGTGDNWLSGPIRTGQQYININYNLTDVYCYGNLAALWLGSDLVVYNTLEQGENAAEAVIWQADLGETYLGPSPRFRTTRTYAYSNAFTGTRMIAVDSNRKLLNSVGAVTPDGVYYRRVRELACVDPLSGEVLWSRDDAAVGSELFASGKTLILAPQDGGEAVVYSALDGRELRRIKVPELNQRISRQGANLLQYQSSAGGKIEFQLRNLETDGLLWSATFSNACRGYLIDSDEFCVLEPQGKLAIVSLRTGKQTLDATVAPTEALQGVYVLRSSNQYIVATNSSNHPAEEGVSVSPLPSGNHSPVMHGLIHAFDRGTGRPMWHTPAAVSLYCMPQDQPTETPVLLLLRSLRRQDENARKTYTSVLCLDRRDGRVIYEEDVPNASSGYALDGDVKSQTVLVQLATNMVTLKLTDAPTPPAPPVQAGAFSSKQPSGSVVGNLTRSILNAVGRGIGLNKPDEKQQQRERAAEAQEVVP